jgi:hypothetical protein
MALGPTKHDVPRADERNYDIKTENDQSAPIGMRYLFAATTLMITGTAGFLVIFIVSVLALQGIYQWYPQFVAQQWFIYDQLFTTFTFLGLLFGSLATTLMLSRRNPTIALITALLSTVSGASVSVTSLIAPLAVLWRSVLYYFLPLFIAPLIGALIFYHVKLNYINHR